MDKKHSNFVAKGVAIAGAALYLVRMNTTDIHETNDTNGANTMSKSYTARDEQLISDMIDRAYDTTTGNGSATTKLLKAAHRMANGISNAKTAMRRARAAEEINYHEAAKVFYDRHAELEGTVTTPTTPTATAATDAQPEQATPKGLRAYIYKTSAMGDCSNNGISSRCEEVTIVGEGIDEIFEATPNAPAVRIIKRNVYGRTIFHAQPVDAVSAGRTRWTMGGSYVATSDSRFSQAIANTYGAVALHDRSE